MSYQYTNPYAHSTPTPTGSRSTFGASQAVSSQKCQLLFTGLPPDVGDRELSDTLFAPPLSLPASTTTTRFFYSAEQVSLGMALVSVGNEQDAERIRREYSGQLIDDTYRILVHHVLGPTQVLPPRSTSASSFREQVNATLKPAAKPAAPAVKAPAKPQGEAPGLQLLSRLNKPGSKEQQALLARQKANMKKGPSDLLARLAKQKATSTASKAKAVKLKTGTDKVARAKANVVKDAIDVDKPAAKGKKDKPKSQEELDAEMVLWERQRRFAGQN